MDILMLLLVVEDDFLDTALFNLLLLLNIPPSSAIVIFSYELIYILHCTLSSVCFLHICHPFYEIKTSFIINIFSNYATNT